MEFEAHNKGISSLVMLSEGTLLSGGEKDRKIAAWDSLQNYKRITDTKVFEFFEENVVFRFDIILHAYVLYYTCLSLRLIFTLCFLFLLFESY